MRAEFAGFEREVPVAMSRRRDVRLDVPRRVTVSLLPAQGPAFLKDISIRGLCVVASGPLPLRSVHQVVLALGRRRFTHRARTIHCHEHPAGGWLMGMEFVGEPLPQLCTIDDFIEEIVATSASFS